MKKTVIGGLACLAALSMSFPVSAHGRYHCGGQNCDRNYCFIDEDGDGICDNSRCADAEGNSVCGTGVYADEDHVCAYFIDEDEDGICDHCVNLAAYAQSRRSSRSGHHGSHHGRGHH